MGCFPTFITCVLGALGWDAGAGHPKGLDIHLFLSSLSFITIVGWDLGGVS
jgi:hypothetical protein